VLIPKRVKANRENKTS
jgi:hypothetical protein